MIERFFEKLIEELGATGLLVIGLYFILYKPIRQMAHHLKIINHELQKIVFILDGKKIEKDKDGGKD